MNSTSPLRGVATISFWAVDHAAATAWYTELLGTEPYFVRDGYAEYRIGDYETELGIIDAQYSRMGISETPSGAVLYWAVDDLASALERLLALGATVREPIIDRTEGFMTAAVTDPFGNILGIMSNPHYAEVRSAQS